MKKIVLLLTISTLFQHGFAQDRPKEQIGIDVPVIRNDTEIFNVYSGARASYISGKAVSYGVNVHYSRFVWKGAFVTGGLGYFNQNFGIERPFNFNGDSTKYGYHTRRYCYTNIGLVIGLGYDLRLLKIFGIRGRLLFNDLFSMRQKYVPVNLTNHAFKKHQVENRLFSFGQMLNLNMGAYVNLTKKVSVGADLVLPLYSKWRKDRIFEEDESEHYTSRYSKGYNISLKYNLKP